jgi:hypothetical protein
MFKCKQEECSGDVEDVSPEEWLNQVKASSFKREL